MPLLHSLFRGGPPPGDEWTGPHAIFDGAEVGFAKAHYALTPDGKRLLLVRGRPVRLVQVDLAPGDPTDGSEKYVVAGRDDPPQRAIDGTAPTQGSTVSLDVEPVEGKAAVSADNQDTAGQIAEELRRRRDQGGQP